MHLLDLRDLVGNLAVVTTVLQFLSGVLVCKQYVTNRTTGEASSLPFHCGILSSALWFLYGLAKHDDKIVLVNAIGVTLMLSYIVVYYIYCLKKSAVLKQCIVVIMLLFIVIAYILTVEDSELVISRLGVDGNPSTLPTPTRNRCLFASAITLLTIAAPMSKLLHVLKVKNTECLPFPMILMSFFVSALWFLYGEIEEDMNLATVNAIGGCIAVAQLGLFAIYPRKQQSLLLPKHVQN